MKLQLLNDMMIFVKVVDNNSFTGAARDLDVSKSAISKYITRLERNLDAQLLHRSTRSLTLTEAGRALYDSMASICDDLEEAERAVSYTSASPRGILHVSCPLSFSYLHLAPATSKFMSVYPDIKVQLMLGSRYVDSIDKGIDVAIQVGDLPDSNLVARRLAMRPMRVCGAPSYLEKHDTPMVPDDLKSHNCLRHESAPDGVLWRFQYPEGERRIKVSGNLTANSRQTLEAAAVAGAGIVMLPGYMMTQDIKQGRLISLLEAFCPRNIGIYAVYSQTRHLAPKARVFIDFLVEYFQSEGYWAT